MTSHQSPYSLIALALDAGNGTFLDHVAARANLRRACRHVAANHGAPGTDGMTVGQLRDSWPQLECALSRQISTGAYAPAPLRRAALPKPGGRGVRLLGIPTAIDRVVHQAIAQPLGALLDEGFSPHSFAYRPGRSAHDALLQTARFAESGLGWVLHLDLEKFFDTVPHELLLARIRASVNDSRLLALIQRCIAAPFAAGKKLQSRVVGLPQGSPLSPLLANAFLDDLDRRLSDAGFAFCRYADDICLYCESQTDAREALAMITPWIERELKLRLNRQKTRIVPLVRDEFLGYRFVSDANGRIAFAPSASACERLRSAVRRLLVEQRNANPGELIGTALMPLLRGWAAYFSLSEQRRFVSGLDRWVVTELRCWLWRRIRDPRRRARNLIKRGVPRSLAWELVSGSRTATTVAQSGIFQKAYPDSWLRERGWSSCREAGGGIPSSDSRGQWPNGHHGPQAGDSTVDLAASLQRAVQECVLYELNLLLSMIYRRHEPI